MFSFIKNFVFPKQLPIDINSLTELKAIRYDTFNSKLESKEKCEFIIRFYFSKDVDVSIYKNKLIKPHISNFDNDLNELFKKSIAFITYRRKTGQIGYFYVNHEHRDRGLGKQILLKVIQDLPERDEIFAVTKENHPFWSNVFNKSFVWSKCPNKSVTGNGYLLDCKKFRQIYT